MGTILSFGPRGAAIKQTRPPLSGAASIIIFPGVRYERPSAAEPKGSIMTGVGKPGGRKPARPVTY